MLIFRKIGLLVLSILFVLIASNHRVYADPFRIEALGHGFNISNDYDGYTEIVTTDFTYYESGQLNHFSRIIELVTYNNKLDGIYSYMYKVITEPYQVRNWGFLGIGSHSDDWLQKEVSVEVYLLHTSGEVLQSVPENNPSIYTTNIGVGLGSSGFELSAGVNYNHSELSIENTGSYFYRNYKVRHLFNSLTNSTYVKNTISTFGIFLFTAENNQLPRLFIKMNIRYFGSFWYYGNSNEGHKYYERIL